MRYLLQKSDEDQLWWILTDKEEQIVCKFKEGEFNKTQKFTPLHDVGKYDISKLPHIVNQMTEWLYENHFEILCMSPQTVVQRCRRLVGQEIRDARESEGYTLRQLSKMTGIAFNHIGRIEQGRYNVTLDTLAVIGEALGMEIGFFVPDDED